MICRQCIYFAGATPIRILLHVILFLVAVFGLSACAGQLALSPIPPQSFKNAIVKQGKFRVTFYQIVDEKHPRFAGEPCVAALLGPANDLLALVSPNFKKRLALEGSGRLRDGRVVNFSTRTGEGIRYQIVEDAPYGIGIGNYKLRPYRTIAVDPTQILLGSVVFIPQAYGMILPNGEIHDGFFLAHDTGKNLKGRHVDLFVGFENHVKNTFTRYGRLASQQEVDLYVVGQPIAGALEKRYRRAYQRREVKPLYEMSAAEIDQLLRETGAAQPELVSRITIYSERAGGTPYRWFPLGEGPQGKYDRDPLVDFSHVDCQTFCEQILAMSISDNYAEMFQYLQRLRYREGIIDIRNRNHFTIADWLPDNAWLIEDVTPLIGGNLAASMTKTIDRKAALRRKGVPETELHAIPPPETMTIKYIPEENLSAIKAQLQGGELACIVQNRPGIFAAHIGFILRDRYGNVLFRNASSRPHARQVVDEFFDDVVKHLRRNANWVGMVFMRVRPEFQSHPEAVAREVIKQKL